MATTATVPTPPKPVPPLGPDPFASHPDPNVKPGVQYGAGLAGGPGWAPANHPLALGAGGQPPAGGGQPPAGGGTGGAPTRPTSSSYTPNKLPGSTISPYKASTFQTAIPAAYSYSAGSLPQFQGMNQQHYNLEGQTSEALQRALTENPYSAERIEQMKARSREDTQAMGQQLQGEIGEGAAARGVSRGGAAAAATANARQQTASDVLRGYRDIDIATAGKNQEAALAAAAGAGTFLTGQAARTTDLYRAALEGKVSEEELRAEASRQGISRGELQLRMEQAQADEAHRAWESQSTLEERALQTALENEKLGLGAAELSGKNYATDLEGYYKGRGQDVEKELGLGQIGADRYKTDVSRELGLGGLEVDRSRIGESGRQFDLQHELNKLIQQENIRQFNRRLGYDYAGLQAGVNQNLFNSAVSG